MGALADRRRFALLSDHLDGQDYVDGSFSVADAYLLAVLNWCEYAGVAIADWPVLLRWRTRCARGLRSRRRWRGDAAAASSLAARGVAHAR